MKIDFESKIFFRFRLFIFPDRLILHPTKKNNNIWDIIFVEVLFALFLNPKPHTLPDTNSSPLNKGLPKNKKSSSNSLLFIRVFLLVFREKVSPPKKYFRDLFSHYYVVFHRFEAFFVPTYIGGPTSPLKDHRMKSRQDA